MAATGPVRGCPVACEFACCKLVARVRSVSAVQLLGSLLTQSPSSVWGFSPLSTKQERPLKGRSFSGWEWWTCLELAYHCWRLASRSRSRTECWFEFRREAPGQLIAAPSGRWWMPSCYRAPASCQTLCCGSAPNGQCLSCGTSLRILRTPQRT